jgi:non-homologous end joining protein Ku
VDLHEITENEIREVLSIETEELALFKTFVSDTKAFFSILCNKDISSVDLNEKIKAKSEQNESKVIEKPSDSKKISDQLFQIILDQTKSSLQKNMVKK